MIALYARHIYLFNLEKVNLTCHNLLDELYRLIEAVKTNKDSDWRYFCVKEAWINAYSMKSC